jgi:hypothetical protein
MKRAAIGVAGAVLVGLAAFAHSASASSSYQLSWQPVYQEQNSAGGLSGITAPAKNDAWAVGYDARDNGSIYGQFLLHWNGYRWRKSRMPVVIYQPDVIGSSSPSNVWIFGSSSNGREQAVRFTGRRWIRMPNPPDALPNSFGLVVLSPDNVWAGGGESVDHWDGKSWTTTMPGLTNPTGFGLGQVSGTTPGDVWVAGLTGTSINTEKLVAYRWQDGQWRWVPHMPHLVGQAACVIVQSPKSVWVSVGNQAPALWHWTGRGWSRLRSPGLNGCMLAPYGTGGVWGDESDLWTGHTWLEVNEGEASYPVDLPVIAPIPRTSLDWVAGSDDSGAVIMRTVRT